MLLDRIVSSFRIVLTVAIVVTIVGVATPADAGTFGMRWDAVSDPDLVGYRVHYGTSSGNYTLTSDLGTVTSTTLTGLDSCTVYYAAVKARNSAGLLSEQFSNEVSGWSRPEIVSALPATAVRGTQYSLAINGDNFRPGSTVVFTPASLQIVSANVDSCNRITMTVSVGASAPLGPVAVRVVHPDNVFGETAALIDVTSDTSGPQITGLAAGSVGSTTATISWTTDEAADSTVRYRKSGEAAWQQAPTDSALETSHSVSLVGLEPSSTYQVEVDSADDQGNSSTSGGLNFTTTSSAFAYLALESEWVPVGGTLSTVSAGQAFGGAYVRQAPSAATGSSGSPSGTWEMEFFLPRSATWRFWYRIADGESATGAWFESVDGAGYSAVQAGAGAGWTWIEGRPFALAAGSHTVSIGGNEPGAWMDRILVTDDAGFVPFAGPNGDTTAPPPVNTASTAGSDGTVTVSWTDPNAPDLDRIVIRRSIGADFPEHPLAGEAVAEVAGSPGNSGSWIDSGLTNGSTYRYSIFAIDASGNVSTRVTVTGVPEAAVSPPSNVENLTRDDTL